MATVTSAATSGSAAAQSGLSATGNATDSGASGNTTAAALDTLLTQNLTVTAQAAGTTPTTAHGPATTASAPATATASAAALTAAQLTGGPAFGLQHARPDPTTMTVSSPVGSNAWTEELATKVTWMAHQGIESASLHLSPEHLGPLQVTISVRDGQASVWFGAAQPDTRTALQQSLPQLRQLFANQGITLADAGVSRESPRGQDQQRPTRGPSISGVAAVNLESPSRSASLAGGLGLVDTYA